MWVKNDKFLVKKIQILQIDFTVFYNIGRKYRCNFAAPKRTLCK